jgi:hypothetical protein
MAEKHHSDPRLTDAKQRDFDHAAAYYLEEHVLCLGQSRSGKSSTNARVLLNSMTKHGYGALLTCVKTTDHDDYLRILRQAGRDQDVIHITLDDQERS